MSRVGKLPVALPAGVKAHFASGTMTVEGPKGTLSMEHHDVVSFENKGAEVIVSRANDEKQTRAYHGLYRNMLRNMVVGVSAGFTRTLQIAGVGYRAEVKGDILLMNLGYSQEIYVGIPSGLKVTTDAGGKVEISGIDKQQVGEFAAQIRKLREPEPYKGKGIRYIDERIRRKVGKSGVK